MERITESGEGLERVDHKRVDNEREEDERVQDGGEAAVGWVAKAARAAANFGTVLNHFARTLPVPTDVRMPRRRGLLQCVKRLDYVV